MKKVVADPQGVHNEAMSQSAFAFLQMLAEKHAAELAQLKSEEAAPQLLFRQIEAAFATIPEIIADPNYEPTIAYLLRNIQKTDPTGFDQYEDKTHRRQESFAPFRVLALVFFAIMDVDIYVQSTLPERLRTFFNSLKTEAKNPVCSVGNRHDLVTMFAGIYPKCKIIINKNLAFVRYTNKFITKQLRQCTPEEQFQILAAWFKHIEGPDTPFHAFLQSVLAELRQYLKTKLAKSGIQTTEEEIIKTTDVEYTLLCLPFPDEFISEKLMLQVLLAPEQLSNHTLHPHVTAILPERLRLLETIAKLPRLLEREGRISTFSQLEAQLTEARIPLSILLRFHRIEEHVADSFRLYNRLLPPEASAAALIDNSKHLYGLLLQHSPVSDDTLDDAITDCKPLTRGNDGTLYADLSRLFAIRGGMPLEHFLEFNARYTQPFRNGKIHIYYDILNEILNSPQESSIVITPIEINTVLLAALFRPWEEWNDRFASDLAKLLQLLGTNAYDRTTQWNQASSYPESVLNVFRYLLFAYEQKITLTPFLLYCLQNIIWMTPEDEEIDLARIKALFTQLLVPIFGVEGLLPEAPASYMLVHLTPLLIEEGLLELLQTQLSGFTKLEVLCDSGKLTFLGILILGLVLQAPNQQGLAIANGIIDAATIEGLSANEQAGLQIILADPEIGRYFLEKAKRLFDPKRGLYTKTHHERVGARALKLMLNYPQYAIAFSELYFAPSKNRGYNSVFLEAFPFVYAELEKSGKEAILADLNYEDHYACVAVLLSEGIRPDLAIKVSIGVPAEEDQLAILQYLVREKLLTKNAGNLVKYIWKTDQMVLKEFFDHLHEWFAVGKPCAPTGLLGEYRDVIFEKYFVRAPSSKDFTDFCTEILAGGKVFRENIAAIVQPCLVDDHDDYLKYLVKLITIFKQLNDVESLADLSEAQQTILCAITTTPEIIELFFELPFNKISAVGQRPKSKLMRMICEIIAQNPSQGTMQAVEFLHNLTVFLSPHDHQEEAGLALLHLSSKKRDHILRTVFRQENWVILKFISGLFKPDTDKASWLSQYLPMYREEEVVAERSIIATRFSKHNLIARAKDKTSAIYRIRSQDGTGFLTLQIYRREQDQENHGKKITRNFNHPNLVAFRGDTITHKGSYPLPEVEVVHCLSAIDIEELKERYRTAVEHTEKVIIFATADGNYYVYGLMALDLWHHKQALIDGVNITEMPGYDTVIEIGECQMTLLEAIKSELRHDSSPIKLSISLELAFLQLILDYNLISRPLFECIHGNLAAEKIEIPHSEEEEGETDEPKSLSLSRAKITTPSSVTLKLLRQVAAGAAYMHERGVAHLGINPHNVFIKWNGNEKQPRLTAKLGGFRFAREFQEGVENSLSSLEDMTPKYMAPEVARLYTFSDKSDVYSWAIMAVAELTGTSLFYILTKRQDQYGYRDTVSNLNTARNKHGWILEQTSTIGPAALRNLLNRCLSLDPAQRPIMAEVVRELTAIEKQQAKLETRLVELIAADEADEAAIANALKDMEVLNFGCLLEAIKTGETTRNVNEVLTILGNASKTLGEDSRLDVLQFCGLVGVDESGITAIAELIKNSNKLRQLRLDYTELTGNQLEPITNALEQSNMLPICRVDLRYCSLEVAEEVVALTRLQRPEPGWLGILDLTDNRKRIRRQPVLQRGKQLVTWIPFVQNRSRELKYHLAQLQKDWQEEPIYTNVQFLVDLLRMGGADLSVLRRKRSMFDESPTQFRQALLTLLCLTYGPSTMCTFLEARKEGFPNGLAK